MIFKPGEIDTKQVRRRVGYICDSSWAILLVKA